ncbi:MAG: hypothetical protein ACYDD0_01745 [Candidatus Dormibacteria bacterium]
MTAPAVWAKHLSRSFGATRALVDVSFVAPICVRLYSRSTR